MDSGETISLTWKAGGMINRIILGNIISLGAAACLTFSCIVKDQKRAYGWQMGESIFLSLSSICFASWAGLSTLLLSILRNWLAMHERFTERLMIVFSVITVVLGLLLNSKGWVGLLPVAATLELTCCNYKAKTLRQTRIGFLINILMWMVYSYMILDIVSGVTQTISAIACIVALWKMNVTPS